MKKIILLGLLSVACAPLFAQTYNPKVSRDSLGVLNSRIEILKTNIKVMELKVKESEEEANVEKLRLKLLEANGNAKESSEKASKNSNRTDAGSSVDLKTMEKLSKKAKSDADDALKALERFNKQISKVEDIRSQIQAEERKLGYKKPLVAFNY
ncbi:hypothetical protein [Pedobacter punctiformis]|uniref:SlyB protein n=1 Tax=Pedobacter punctiformis TaxID=3004097 RepID=A0ABT4LBR4_9SPHI|nr:hypothetical protein [Pedobacter sp. HCMS5-2]MCZ4245350.1 hypothetical protein [Pedobacter sp. HCMS5-2]